MVLQGRPVQPGEWKCPWTPNSRRLLGPQTPTLVPGLSHCRDFTHCLILNDLPLYDRSCFISKDAKPGTHGGEQVCHSSWPPSCCLWGQHAGPLSPKSLTGTDLGLGWWLRWAVHREKRVRHRVRTPALHLGPACMCSVAAGWSSAGPAPGHPASSGLGGHRVSLVVQPFLYFPTVAI